MSASFLFPAYYVAELIWQLNISKKDVYILTFPYVLLILSLNTHTKKMQKSTELQKTPNNSSNVFKTIFWKKIQVPPEVNKGTFLLVFCMEENYMKSSRKTAIITKLNSAVFLWCYARGSLQPLYDNTLMMAVSNLRACDIK